MIHYTFECLWRDSCFAENFNVHINPVSECVICYWRPDLQVPWLAYSTSSETSCNRSASWYLQFPLLMWQQMNYLKLHKRRAHLNSTVPSITSFIIRAVSCVVKMLYSIHFSGEARIIAKNICDETIKQI